MGATYFVSHSSVGVGWEAIMHTVSMKYSTKNFEVCW